LWALWSIRLNCQLMTKLETKHILQAQVCDCVSTKNETGNQWCIIKSAKSSTLKLDSFEIWLRNQLTVHNYLQRWCNWTQTKKSPVLKGPLKTVKPTNIPLITFPLKVYYEVKSKISSTLVQLTANFFEWNKTDSNEISRTWKKRTIIRTVWVNSTGYLLQLCKFGIGYFNHFFCLHCILAVSDVGPYQTICRKNTLYAVDAELRDPTWESAAPGRVEKCRPPQSVA